MSTPIILCTPRVASRYFAAAFQKKTGIDIQKTHSPEYKFKDDHKIIGIVRDPLDSITSDIAMGHFLQNTPPNDEINIDGFIDRYIKTNKKIIEASKAILIYEDFTNNLDFALEKVVNKLDIQKPSVPNYIPYHTIEDRIDSVNGYLVSSKTYSQYDSIKAKILQHDLCEAYEIYQAACEISRYEN
jgi:hypothetical protein